MYRSMLPDGPAHGTARLFAVNRSVTRSSGYTLIEVLVALLVISLGLLGMAALQVTALKQNQNAYSRSQILTAAHGMSDRIRSNKTGLESGSYFGDADEYDSDDPDTSCENSVCSAAEMAAYDLNNWKFYLQNAVNGGGGCITREPEDRKGLQVDAVSDLAALCTEKSTASNPVTIYVWWNDSRYKNTDEAGTGKNDIQVVTLSMDI